MGQTDGRSPFEPLSEAAYDSNAKVAPPLRSRRDVDAMVDGLVDGTVDFIATEVEPVTREYHRLGAEREDHWGYHPGQLKILEGLKGRARGLGLWNFFLPDAETGEGLANLDYAYIAAELGKNPIASEVSRSDKYSPSVPSSRPGSARSPRS